MSSVSPQYIRARHAVIEREVVRLRAKIHQENLGRYSTEEKEKEALLDGFFPGSMDEQSLITEMLSQENFSTYPLSFLEKNRWSAWFVIYPDRVFGKEIETSSRAFNITVKGSEAEIKAHFHNYFNPSNSEMKEKLRLRARALKLRLQFMDLDGLSGLGKSGVDQPGNKALALRNILQKSEAEEEYKQGDKLEFDSVVRQYNKGISKAQIQAWVWYKRTLGVPMTGWEKFYLSSVGGERTVMLVTTTPTVIRDARWLELRTVPAGRTLGKANGFSHSYDDVNYLVYRDEEGLRLCRADHQLA